MLIAAYFLRSKFTNAQTKKYFIPALTLKFIGAICLGVIYQFYYSGGDTFNYWQHGSRWIWEAFLADPGQGLKMIFANIRDQEHFEYYSQIWLRRSETSLFLIKITAFIDIFTFHTYSATAIFFALYSFSGLWAMYMGISKIFPDKTKLMAIGIFLMPSVIIWGSGIMKDTLVVGSLGWMTWSLINWIEYRKVTLYSVIVFGISFLIIFNLKIYIVILFVPAIGLWLYLKSMSRIRSLAFRLLIAPVMLLFFAVLGYFAAQNIGEGSDRYALTDIPTWSRVTAYDLRYWTGRDAGSGYSLGALDGTWSSMLSYAPAAVNVSLFRPYPWEVTSVLMLLTSIESLLLLVFTLRLPIKNLKNLKNILSSPILVFFLFFVLAFAFAVGVSTYNFGSLARYRIPILPFFGVILAVASGAFNKIPIKKSGLTPQTQSNS